MGEIKLNDASSNETKIDLVCKVDELETKGSAVRRDFSKGERAVRAGKSFGILFTIGLFSVFVPLLHFVLPPLFLCAAIGFAIVTYIETAEVVSGECTCPNCKKEIVLAREAEDWPMTMRCPGCSFTLSIAPSGTP